MTLRDELDTYAAGQLLQAMAGQRPRVNINDVVLPAEMFERIMAALDRKPEPDAKPDEAPELFQLGAETMRVARDDAYRERDRLVCALSKLWPAHLARHPDDEPWDDDWRWIVCIHSPVGQLSWHIHDSERSWFDHLSVSDGDWDGHTTEEKYQRLDSLRADATPDEGTAQEALKQLLGAVYDLHGNPEDCEECGVLADAKYADQCAVHSSQKLYDAWLAAEAALGPCVCGHTVHEHNDCDERRCAQDGCACRFFRSAALRPSPTTGQET